MSVELLVSTFKENNYEELFERLNIQTDAVIINQNGKYAFERMDYKGNSLKVFECDEVGSGTSRSNALLRATADYCIIADDDMEYVDGYERIVDETFAKNPDADLIVFNLEGHENVNKKRFKVKYHNFMRFGTAKIAFRRKSIAKNGIYFNSSFGAGAENGSGEDTLFLAECLKKGLKIVAVPITIARLLDIRESTWFNGYTEAFLKNKGKAFCAINRRLAPILCLLILLKNRQFAGEKGLLGAYKLMLDGVKEFKNR